MPAIKDSRRVFTGMYFDREQHAALRKLSDRTRVPLATYMREGADMVLRKYRKKMRGKNRSKR
jgi:hypothetical protein